MKEMIYKSTLEREVLERGKYKGYEFEIISYGTHPCAYVCVPVGHPFYEKPYDEVDVDCHWGCTYSQRREDGKWWIGWDYAHFEDYSGVNLLYESIPALKEFANDFGKKWTTDEILKEVFEVIDQLIAEKN